VGRSAGLGVEARRTAFHLFGDKTDREEAVRPLLKLLRFVLQVQGAVVIGGGPSRDGDAVEIRIRRHRNAKPRCPRCNRALGGRLLTKRRAWRHLDVLRKRTLLVSDVREGHCARHGRRVERVPWADPASRHTYAFDEAVASLVQVADKSAASRMFRVTWRTVGRIVTRVVARHLPADRLDNLECIAVDETSYKRGHRYMTVVLDLFTNRVVWIGEGKSEKTLLQFFEALGPARSKQIRLVAMDMSGAYKNAVQARAPNAEIIYDRFHVVKLLLDAIDEIRRDEVRKLHGDERKQLKNTRYAMLRNPKRHLSDRDRQAVARVRRSNQKLARAYELRCDFEELWEREHPEDARDFLNNWTRAALRSRREPLRRFAKTVRAHMDGILGYFKFWRITSGPIEGNNNKVKLAIHRAFGFHSVEALMSMVYLCCSGIDLQW